MKIISSILFFILFLATYLFSQDNNNLQLTKDEIKWIKQNDVITVANEMDWPPFDYNKFGKAQGLSIEYIELIAKKLDLKIDFVYNLTWTELLKQFEEKKIDILPALYKNEKRKEFTNYTTPYYKAKMGVFKRTGNNSINSLKDLKNLRVGIQKSDASIDIIEYSMAT